MIQLAEQERRHTYQDQTFGHGGRRRGWDVWENSIETYTLPYVKWIASGSLLYEAGNPKLVLCDILGRWDGEGDGRGFQEGGYIGTSVADSCWCMAESPRSLPPCKTTCQLSRRNEGSICPWYNRWIPKSQWLTPTGGYFSLMENPNVYS